MVRPVKKHVLFCEHCGNKTPQIILFEYDIEIEIDIPPEAGGGTYPMSYFYVITKCGTCADISMYGFPEDEEIEKRWLLYPKIDELKDISIPLNTRKIYAEASKIKIASPTACCIMIRKALESICKDKKASGGTLENRLNDLSKKGILPSTLAETGHILREIGNIGVHDVDGTMDFDDVRTMDDFFKFMVEYIYITPAKLDKIKNRTKKKPSKKS